MPAASRGAREAEHPERLWDAATGQEIAKAEFNPAAFSPDGTRVGTASGDGTARFWDAGTRKEIAVLRHEDQVLSAAFAPDSTRMVTAAAGGTARIWRIFPTLQGLVDHARAIQPRGLTPEQRRWFFLE